MSTNITVPTDENVQDFLATLEHEEQRRDSLVLLGMMSEISGHPPVMWGTSIIGFGKHAYKYASGREGEWMKIGFSPRKGKFSLYVTYDANKFAPELEAVGKHKIGKGCVYITRLADIDQSALKHFIAVAYEKGWEL